MNKKIILGLVSLSFLASFKPVVGMHGNVLRGVQIVTSGAVIGVCGKKAYSLNEELKKPVDLPRASEEVNAFVFQGLVKLNVPNAIQVPVVVADNPSPWFVIGRQAIGVNSQTAAAIESGNDVVIREGQSLEKHEIKHLLNNDVQKRAYARIGIPCAVQLVSSGLTYGCNKAIGRQKPKSILPLLGRSLMAVGAMGTKVVISGLGIIAYIRYQEAQADQFACEHAESRQELEVFKNFWDKETAMYEQVMSQQAHYVCADEKQRNRMVRIFQFTSDIEHPYSSDRAAMVQKYIDKWDAEHSA